MKCSNIINQRFDKLVVLSEEPSKTKKGRRRRYYKCLCDCGNICVKNRDSLIGNYTRSCGCKINESRAERAKERLKYKDPSQIRYLYTMAKGNAKYNNRTFTLTYEEYKKYILESCYYCGVEPSNLCKKKKYYGELKYNGIDRIDSSKGYEESNCVTCCFICNRAKMDMGFLEFLNYIQRLIKFNKDYDKS